MAGKFKFRAHPKTRSLAVASAERSVLVVAAALPLVVVHQQAVLRALCDFRNLKKQEKPQIGKR